MGTENIFNVFGLSDVGKVRQNNEDAFLCLPQYGVFCVADGMGGMRDGAIASQTTVNCIEQAFNALNTAPDAPPPTFKQRRETLITALEEANRRMQPKSWQSKKDRSGSTVVAVLLDHDTPNRACVIHAGDSRLYRLRKGNLEQITHDHSGAELLEKMGPEYRNSPLAERFRNRVTRGIGIEKRLNHEETHLELRSGDLLLLCSDGLTNMVAAETMCDILAQAPLIADLAKTCSDLVEAANDADGLDNITVIVIRVGAIPEPITADTPVTTEPGTESCDTLDSEPVPPSMVDRLPAALRQRLTQGRIVGLGLVMVAVVLLAGLRSCRRAASPEPIVYKPTSERERVFQAEREALLKRIEQAYQAAMQSGDWASLQSLVDQGHLDDSLTRDDYALPLHSNIAAWYALWNQASEPDFDAADALRAFTEMHMNILSRLSSEVSLAHPENGWPEGANERSNRYCVEIHGVQQQIMDRIIAERSHAFAHYESLLDRSAVLRATDLDNDHASDIALLVNDLAIIREEITSLTRNISANRDRPWTGSRRIDLDWAALTEAFHRYRQQISAFEAMLGN